MDAEAYQTILVGVDGSEQANLAFKRAVEVAKRNQGKVIVAHVIENRMYSNLMGYSTLNDDLMEQETESAERLLKERQAQAKSMGLEKVETVVTYGIAKNVMSKELPEKYNVDLIMVGQSGLNAVERVMIGSVSSYIIRHAPCDVLIVHPEETES